MDGNTYLLIRQYLYYACLPMLVSMQLLPAVRSEEHILQCVRGAVGCGDEAKKKEDEVGNTEQLSQLFVDDLFPEGHLLLCVPPKPVPTNDALQDQKKDICINVFLIS